MTFNSTKLTITQMAQWVDANISNPQRDDYKLVEYVYHIAYIKANRAGLFSNFEVYDDFALFCVSKFLIRISNQQEAPVKSVVNYFKTVLEPWRAEYVREYCSGCADADTYDFNLCDFGDYLIDATSHQDYDAFDFYCIKISDVVLQHLKTIPRKRNSAEWSNICTSCLLTLQDRITCAVTLCKSCGKNQTSAVVRQLKTKPPILFHLDETFSTYISVLVNEIIHAISVEITKSTFYNVSPASCLKNLVKAANNDEED